MIALANRVAYYAVLGGLWALVYVDLDEYGAIILTTEHGLKVTNRIVLEPVVCLALKEYVDRKAGRR